MVRSLTGGSGRPSTAAGERVFPSSAAGRFETAAAWVTPGSAAEFFESVLKKQTLLLNIRIGTGRQPDEKRRDTFGAETGIDVLEPAETIDQQDSADEQHQGERDFGDKQTGPQSPGLPACRSAGRIL